MPMYSNIGGGQKQIASLYINNNVQEDLLMHYMAI